MIKKLLCDSIENQIPAEKCAVLLSGGVDSHSVAFAAERLGKKVHAYSFVWTLILHTIFKKPKKLQKYSIGLS